jgi:subtilase family serine protease
MRAVPDIAADANRETGAWVLDSGNGGWYIVGGISLASPTIAGITNLSSSFAPWTNAELTKIYSKKASNPTAFRLAGNWLLRPLHRLHGGGAVEFLHGRRRSHQ